MVKFTTAFDLLPQRDPLKNFFLPMKIFDYGQANPAICYHYTYRGRLCSLVCMQ
jgi:hypothetical protein